MLKNHFVGALRNFIKHRNLNLIHIVGLALGLTAGIYVICYSQLEYQYDRFHSGAGNIYRVSTTRLRDGAVVSQFASTFAGVAPALREYTEVENTTRMFKRFRGGVVSYGDTRFRETEVFHIDSGFFKVFSFPIVAGDAKDILAPGIAFVEETTARKYFGSEDPVGKRIRFGSVNGIEEYEIRGVVQCPETSSLKFTFLFSYHDLGRIFGTEHLTNWDWLDFHTFVKLKSNISSSFESKLPEMMMKFRGERSSNFRLELLPLTDLYFKSDHEFETGITGNEDVVRIMLILGITIIAIVWMNFVNLSTSQALERAKEVGIRKVLGSSRRNLVTQFLVETSLLNLVSIVVAFLLLWILLPYFNQLTGKLILFSDLLEKQWLYLVVFFAGSTILIGSYPALQLSAFPPLLVLRSFFKPTEKGAILREGFVALQALVSFSLIASILVVFDQMKFVSSRDLGISIDRTLVVRTPEVVLDPAGYLTSLDAFKNELRSDPRILSVSTSADSPGADVNWISGTRRAGAEPREATSFYKSIIDKDFLETMDLTVLVGEGFRENHSSREILLNEAGIPALGFESPSASIGQLVLSGPDTFRVIGVIKDFHQVSPRKPILPTMFHLNLETPTLFFIRFSANEPNEIVSAAGKAYTRLYPGELFDYYFLDEFYDLQNADDQRLLSVISVFCGLAIAVSALGLLGLTWFRVSRQKKELAVRKIVGSTQRQLFYEASRRLFKTTLIGCAPGIPLTWYLMLQWLQTFSTHTTPKPWQFVIALIASLAIALVSVSGYTLKVIRTNPAHHLRQD